MRLLRLGDWLTLGIAALAVLTLAHVAWQPGPAARVRLYSAGTLYAEVDLAARQTLQIPGPLGLTRVEVAQGRARIQSDPGPRQYCVRSGWLRHPGESAVCLPNRTAIALVGAALPYDSLGY
ncbi:NusG domain II-containing protein [Chitiniphilus purpureus]|uniref:NusG domain II-containing protein n=1 Tax=Chitiniphilus purpureus TaxID=2981137 RepID=A0ABY6DP72_9NEIS|nr:NusG domain II-containing protein [Chitiniphilus sp. CD1]UXY15281.1 NusG domain II-containing protein [Chitiniphilus sp. CD1]